MSQWCEFYIGDPKEIAALLEQSPDEGNCSEHIEFPNVLHGGPDPVDEWFLEALTRLACEVRDVQEFVFDVAEFDELGGDEDDEDVQACIVSEAWVELLGNVERHQLRTLAVGIVKRLALSSDESNIGAILEDVKALVELCRTAHANGLRVVYTWTM